MTRKVLSSPVQATPTWMSRRQLPRGRAPPNGCTGLSATLGWVQQCDSGERHDVDWATYDATMSVRGPDDGVDIHGGGLLCASAGVIGTISGRAAKCRRVTPASTLIKLPSTPADRRTQGHASA